MNIKRLHIFALIVALMMVGQAAGQDPDLQDSLIIGNLDGSIIPVGLNQEVILPVWIKTDDSVTFFHTPLGTDDDHISMRLGGDFYLPLSLWDDVSFLTPNPNLPSPGLTSQSILGFAYLLDPRDPQNFLYTNYEWWHVADFLALTTSDTSVIGDTVCLLEGYSPANGGLLWGIPDGVTQIIPAAAYPCLYFADNIFPEFTQPDSAAEFNVNNEFPIEFIVTATDGDNDVISISMDFPNDGAQLDTVDIYPGYSSYLFNWVPAEEDTGQFTAMFTANDGHGGIAEREVYINVSPIVIQVEEVSGFPCAQVSVPVNLINSGESSHIGGFDILLYFGSPDILELLSVERAPRIDNWDLFNVNMLDSSTVRLVGIGDLTGYGNGLPPGSGPIAFLNFLLGDSVYIGHYADINFIFEDNNDNTLSDTTGYLLIHPQLDSGWVFSMDPNAVLIGDINLNGDPWEVSDAVLLANHIMAPSLFPFNSIQMIASDTNQDGIPASMPDLVYLINVMNGDINPPRLNYGGDISAKVYAEINAPPDIMKFKYDAPIPSGGILMRLDHGGAVIGAPTTNTGLNLQYIDEGGILTILLFDFNGGLINPGDNLFEFEISKAFEPIVTDLQISDRCGFFIPSDSRVALNIPENFKLYGAYPNPFNSSTTIKFALPSQSDVDLTIYNVLGQSVKSVRLKNAPAGENSIDWNGLNDEGVTVSTGVYLYRISAGVYEASSQMTLLK